MFNKTEGSIIFTYKILTGNNAGAYERYLVGQSNKSYDIDRSEELKYWDKNVAPYADALVGQQRWMWEEWATIGDQPEPGGLALFRVELGAHNIVASHRGGHRAAGG